ncbi:AEC family transporter [Demequina sp. NBRC 110056]|uniref:AEC family transporter n=1 Tax=Demequina sp. NBRC 110056 TaxID=1570345 RepID=UPI0009FC8866|nr:AEC family transporter [Demequina sp. NBRC 110056]
MTDVLAAIVTMGVIVAAGWLIERYRWLPPQSRQVLATVCFAVAGPALLLGTVARADLSRLASSGAAVTWGVTLALAVVLAVVARWLLRLPSGRATMTVLSGSYVNAGNLGIPLAVYLFGDALAVVPTMLVQLLVMGPIAFTILDRASDASPVRVGGGGAGARSESADALAGEGGNAASGARRRGPLRTAFSNPLTIGALVGLALALLPWQIPDVALAPFELVGAAAPPLALLTLGMSLVGARKVGADADHAGLTIPLVVATVSRAVVHPLLTFLVGSAVGLDSGALAVVVAMAALPTAQNVVVFANRYGCAIDLASRACLITTALCAPVLLVVAALLL